MPWKRIGLIIGFIALIILLGFFLYLVFFAPAPKPPAPPTPEQPPLSGFPTSEEYVSLPSTKPISSTPPSVIMKELIPETAKDAQGGPVQIHEVQRGSNIAPRLTSNKRDVVSFDEYTGTFNRVKPDGTVEKFSDQQFKGAQKIIWAPQADKAVITFPDSSNIVYDFEKNSQVTIPSHWTETSFSPDGNKLTFKSLGEDPDNRWFSVSNADGSGAKALEPLGTKAALFIPTWSPSGQIAGLFHEGIDYDRQKVYFLGLNGENFKAAVVAGRGLETLWSPNGDRLLHSVYSQSSSYKPELWIVDALGDSIGSNRRRLHLYTWAHKCAFSDNETIYCAVPTSLEEGAGLIPGFGEGEEDHIFRVDLSTGVTTKIAELPEKHTIGTLVVAKDQSVLYFTDKTTGKLYTITL